MFRAPRDPIGQFSLAYSIRATKLSGSRQLQHRRYEADAPFRMTNAVAAGKRTSMSIDQLHQEACARGEASYIDPSNGYRVFTALSLEQRGDCCGCGCRHCPYGHEQVNPETRANLLRDPWIEGPLPISGAVDVLFWSGGKDSYLTLRALEREAKRPVVLLTTFDGRSEKVAHQEISVNDVRRQQRALGCALVLVPLFPSTNYMDRVTFAIQSLQRKRSVGRLVFGDLHLEHVRTWREDALAASPELAELSMYLPLWKRPYSELLDDLEAAPAEARISAVADPQCEEILNVGDLFGRELVARLPDNVDAFGENGEFHSYVEILPNA